MTIESQEKPPKITTLDLGRYIDSIVLPLKLSPIMIVLISRMCKRLTFGSRGIILDLYQTLDESVAEYCDMLNIKEPARVSQAFSRLEKLKITKSTRNKSGMDRQFHPDFVAELLNYSHAQSSTSQHSSCLTKHPQTAQSGTSLMPDQALGSLDRRLDEGIDERMDGIKKPSQKEGTVRSIDYAQRIQVAFFPHSFLEPKEREKFNAEIWGLMAARGVMELEKIVSYIEEKMPLKRQADRNIPKLSTWILRDMVATWDQSPEKKLWDEQFARLSVPDFIGRVDDMPGY